MSLTINHEGEIKPVMVLNDNEYLSVKLISRILGCQQDMVSKAAGIANILPTTGPLMRPDTAPTEQYHISDIPGIITSLQQTWKPILEDSPLPGPDWLRDLDTTKDFQFNQGDYVVIYQYKKSDAEKQQQDTTSASVE